MEVILGIDQGTTGSTAVLLDSNGKLLSKHGQDFSQHFPQAGWVEHDPKEIMDSVRKAVSGAYQKANLEPKHTACIGITNQRETVSLFREKEALHPFIVWQDRRTSADCKKLKPKAKEIHRRSGTPIDPYFSSTKIRWLMKKLEIPKSKLDIRFRTIDSFLLKEFTGEDVIEISNAHRTQLLNLKSGKWDDNLFNIFKIPKTFAPELINSSGMDLKTKDLDFLPDGIPVQGVLGDQQAALYGQMAWKAGQGKITFGTGAFILLHTGTKAVLSKNKLVSTIALADNKGRLHYALEGSVFICGAWVQWLRDQLKMIDESDQIEDLAQKVESSDGVIVVPSLSGLGAPFWNSERRGSISGLTRGSNRFHIARASLEAIAFQNRALVDAMIKDSPQLKTSWRVDGGAVKNDLLMQIQADVLKSKIIRPKNLEATATGAALLAGQAHGLLSKKDIEATWEEDQIFKSDKANAKILDALYRDWRGQVV